MYYTQEKPDLEGFHSDGSSMDFFSNPVEVFFGRFLEWQIHFLSIVHFDRLEESKVLDFYLDYNLEQEHLCFLEQANCLRFAICLKK